MSERKSGGEKEDERDDDTDLLLTDPDVLEEGKYLGDNYSESPLDSGGFTSPFTSDSADAFAAYILDVIEQLYGPQQPNGDAVHGVVHTTTAAGLEYLQRLFPAVAVIHLQTMLRMMDRLGREQFQSQIQDLIPFMFDQNPTRSLWPLNASLVGIKPGDIENAFRAIVLAWTEQQKSDRVTTGNDDTSLLVSRDKSKSGNKRKNSNANETSKSTKTSTTKQIQEEKFEEEEKKDRERHKCSICQQIKKTKKGQSGGASHVCPDTIDVKDDNDNFLFTKMKVVTHRIYDVVTDGNGKKSRGEILRATTEFSWIKINFFDQNKKMKKKNMKVESTNTKSTESASQTVRSYLRGDHKGYRKLSVDVGIEGGIEEEGDTYREVSKQAVAVPLVVPSMSTVHTATVVDVHDGPIPDPVKQEWQLLQNNHTTNSDFDRTNDTYTDPSSSHKATENETGAKKDDHDSKFAPTNIPANIRKVVSSWRRVF